jgi:hypothetical protein
MWWRLNPAIDHKTVSLAFGERATFVSAEVTKTIAPA